MNPNANPESETLDKKRKKEAETSHLAGNAEVFEEALMRGPELSPHRLFHLLLCV
jgi:hypothetical protein